MEAYHFLPDCRGVPWLVVKAVADAADEEVSRQSRQCKAARRAAKSFHVLAELTVAGLIPEPKQSDAVASLCDVILGDTIVVSAAETSAEAE